MIVGLFLVVVFLTIVINRWKSWRILKLSRQLQNKFKAYPLVGHGYVFSGSDVDRMTAFIQFGLEAIKNNGVTSLWLGLDFYTVIADAVIADKVMKSCLEKSNLSDVIRHLLGNGSIFAPVKVWRPRRKVVAPTFSQKNLQTFVEIFSKQSCILAERLSLVADKEAFSVWKYFTTFTMDSVCETALGIKVNAQTQPDQPFLAAFDEYCELIAARMCQPWLRINALYKLFPDSKKLDKYKKLIWDYVDKVVKSKLANKKHLPPDENAKAYKTFLELIIESSGSRCFTNVELREETLVIVLAGTDTSAVGASFTSAMLSRYMEVQNKVYDELCEVFGDSRRPVTCTDLPKLKYLEAVIKETMRLYPPVPIISRKIDKDITLPSGLTLVKETDAIINIWALHRNPRYWGEDATEFRPERFLEGPIEHPAAFMPFSNGARNCLGYQYAMMAMKTVLATVLRRYCFLPAEPNATEADLRKPLRVKYDVMMRNVDNYMVRIESRCKSSADTLVEI
ncbi:unnamed protein product [Parnassius apollo]|uniref:(apollo) hypothetical protein n=1 Tax=Parnassius apollo TaxID=110799 RepID=A0A8S3Y1R7_PARAO|nr:unnamed protein product [Parnassius apollo]